VICCATNHTADKGETGVRDALEFWEKYPEITICGIYSSQEDKDQIRVVEENGIKVAILNYTYGLNGLSFPKDKQYLTNMLDSRDRIEEEIIQAKELADVVVVSPHMGTEYVFKPNEYQRDWVDFFVEAGADVVIGTHPHVLEPCMLIGDTVVFYSLGNFVSNQKKISTVLGGMAEIVFEKDGDDVSIVSYQCIPLVTHYTDTEHMVYKLSDYTEKLASEHTMNQYDSRFSKDYLEELYDEIMSGMNDEILN
jgi:poly-gamma-glutamate synthesis protein (capsule biosynthesis protein)